MADKTGRFAIIEQFLADGMDHMFGNPGTVEQGFLDALKAYPEMRYVLTLQESVAVTMADGYARATKKPTLVQIHSTPGLGNAIGALYQAKRGHAPLVVIGGDSGSQYLPMDAQMAGDLVAFAEPVTKWSTMVTDSRSLLRVLRRAVKIAATPPMGPVYVCLQMDVLDEVISEEVYPASIPSTRSLAHPDLIQDAAAMLAKAKTPMLYVGDGVAYAKAQDELVRVAELLGAEVWEADAGELNMPYTHPLYKGMTGHMFGSSSLPIIQKGDVNLIVGTYMLPEVFPELGNIFAPGAKNIHIDLNAYEIAKNHPVDLGLVANPKEALTQLAEALEQQLSETQRNDVKERTASIAAEKESKHKSALADDEAKKDQMPLDMAQFMAELAPRLPEDVVIFDEALTSSPALVRHAPPTKPDHYFLTRGGSLGVGIPGAIGAKLANPDKLVIGFTGDGGSMYTIQALWSAARHNVAAKFVICNNGSYRLLQLNIDQYWKERDIPKDDFPLAFDLSEPPLGFVEIARGMSVEAVRVETVEQIVPAIEQMLAHDGPFLIDLVLEGDTHPERIGNTCGQ